MSCISLDLTLEGALADPMVAALMRADRIDPKRFEDLLRSKARDLNAARARPSIPFALLASRVRGAVTGSSPRW